MDKWIIFGGYVLYVLAAIGMLRFLIDGHYNPRALRILAALLWPVTLLASGVAVILDVIVSALGDPP